ncbi:uncharacterized protein LOC142339941 isoform X2 [Convolutriloba macropyga]|uniref:uncharacterized protein LOC142339941 isoform X2 n=1 Tax=Convolutriloba macropyga TaxID=536237 RepID=UPI003F51F6E2
MERSTERNDETEKNSSSGCDDDEEDDTEEEDSCDPNDSLLQCQMQLNNFACRVRNMKRQCYCSVRHNRGCDFLRPGDLHVPNGSLFQYTFDTKGNPQNKEARAVESTMKLESRIK